MINKTWVVFFNLYKNFKGDIRQYNKGLILLIIVSILSKALSLIPPFLNGKIIDNVLTANFQSIILLVLLISFISILIGSLSLLQTYININLSNKVLVYLKEGLIRKILNLKMKSFDKMSSGEYIERVDRDINIIKEFYIDTIPSLFISVINVIVSGAFALYLSPTLTIVGFISFPLSSMIYYFFGNRVKKSFVFLRRVTDSYTSLLHQTINSERAIKGLHIEESIYDKIEQKIREVSHLSIQNGMISAYGGLVQLLSATFMEIVLMSIACYSIIKGKMTIGSYVSFNVYLANFLSALKVVASTNLNIQTICVAADRINQITENTEEEKMDGDEITIESGDIIIQHVHFSYDEDTEIFDDLSIDFESKNLYAIVGMSGCGKTTLFNLLLRIYDCEKGNILFDNIDITTMAISNLRDAVSYVQQEAFIFGDTIRENIRIVNPKATDYEIIEACKKADIYNAIRELPEGFDTVIGERGVNLSGGQKQRLAIARGILKRAKIYLFDEITSELDGKSEKSILSTLTDLAKDHTVIVIAHRLTTVLNIPRIIVLNDGRKIAEGTHQELFNNCEVYRKLYQL